jgi:hypothetical protein
MGSEARSGRPSWTPVPTRAEGAHHLAPHPDRAAARPSFRSALPTVPKRLRGVGCQTESLSEMRWRDRPIGSLTNLRSENRPLLVRQMLVALAIKLRRSRRCRASMGMWRVSWSGASWSQPSPKALIQPRAFSSFARFSRPQLRCRKTPLLPKRPSGSSVQSTSFCKS